MTESVQLAIIVAVPPTLAAIGGILMGLRADKRSDAKLNHITVLTNSTLTAANRRIDELEAVVVKMTEERRR